MGIRVTDLEREAQWLSALPMSFGARVRELLPPFPAYARILHRPSSTQSWASIAATTGTLVHPTVQWHAIRPADSDEEPRVGVIDAEIVVALERAIGPGPVFGATWVGWGGYEPPVEGARAQRPGREYTVREGGWSTFLAPNASPAFLWDADHEWMTSTEIDLDSTVLGGREQLIRVILDDPSLEALAIGPDDSLAFDGDLLNR